MRAGRFVLTAFCAAMFASMLSGCATPIVLSDLTEINRLELMKQAKAEREAYEKTEAIVLATEDALHQAAPNEALNWEFASEAAKRAAEGTIDLYRLEAAAGYAKLREIRTNLALQQVQQELAHKDWNIVELGILALLSAPIAAKAKAEAEKAEAARFSPESVAAADVALNSANTALSAAVNVLQQAAPREWAVRLTAVAERDIAWAALNQAVDLIAKGQNVNPVPPESVVVFQLDADIPKHVKIGVLIGRNGGKTRVLNAMRKRAGELGENALIFSITNLPGKYFEYRGTIIRISEETEDRE
ncbi:MAG: hypothetical protein OXT69_14540 [Candidatus Poribacteria bacterium]|nr:hypothetical protein [Candidatus Poribacteria bacterium]